MKRLLFVYCCLCGLVFSACSSNTGTGGVTIITPIVPLGAGFLWVMETTTFDNNGAPLKTITDTIHIYDDTHLSPKGITYYHFDNTYVTERSDGLYNTDLSFSGPYLYLKFPAAVNDVFRAGQLSKTINFPTALKPDSMVTLTTEYLVKAVNTSISVPAGVFSCNEYVTTWSDVKYHSPYELEYYFYSANVGPVQVEHYKRDAANILKLSSRSRLVSKKLN